MCAQRERGKLANVGVARFLIRDREAAELQKQKADELLHQELERQNVLQKLRNTVRIEGMSNSDFGLCTNILISSRGLSELISM